MNLKKGDAEEHAHLTLDHTALEMRTVKKSLRAVGREGTQGTLALPPPGPSRSRPPLTM